MSSLLIPARAAALSASASCPACGTAGMRPFHELRGVPAHSVLLMPTRGEAVAYPRGEIVLALCPICGLISNVAFDQRLNEYDGAYEATQGFSGTFNRFHKRLAQDLIDRFALNGKTVVEIGCGQGEFLYLLSELAGCRGIGFDPAYLPQRDERPSDPNVSVIRDFYSEQYTHVGADLFCCKMTLEHIPAVRDFVTMVRRAIGDRPGASVFFQVPNALYVLRETAFWDIYYEHCSYFTPGTLARLFRSCGFTITDLWCDYNDQYVMVTATAGGAGGSERLPDEESPAEVAGAVGQFTASYPRRLKVWFELINRIRREQLRAVIWGAGSKGVAFFHALQVSDEIPYAVDVNPYKHGTFMPGSGTAIVAPDFLREYQPQLVIAMNPVYSAEIRADLERLGVTAELLAL